MLGSLQGHLRTTGRRRRETRTGSIRASWSDLVQLTLKSHYNPCFWTAHWSGAYSKALREGASPTPRSQLLSVLNIKADRIYTTKVENIHRETIGTLDVTKEQAKQACQVWMPDTYQDSWTEIDASPAQGYTFSVEHLFTFLENSSFYQTLQQVARTGVISHSLEKVNLAGFIVLQLLRNAQLLQAIGDALAGYGRSRFELFAALARFLNDITFIQTIIPDVAHGRWTFYKTYDDRFPLADSPVMVNGGSRMIALSPRLLLESQGSDPALASSYTCVNSVPDRTMKEFKQRTIDNCYKEIVFSSPCILEEWRRCPELAVRRQAIAEQRGGPQVQYSGEPVDEKWLVDLCRRLLFPAASNNDT